MEGRIGRNGRRQHLFDTGRSLVAAAVVPTAAIAESSDRSGQ
jgi:hypothetical protein